MKKIIFIFIIFILFFTKASCEEYDDYLKEEINKIENNELKEKTEEYINGDFSLDFNENAEKATDVFKEGILNNKDFIFKMLSAMLICALIENVSASFGNNFSQVGFLVTFITICTICLEEFYDVVRLSTETIDSLVVFMGSLIPMMLGLVGGSGNPGTATALHPIFFVLGGFITTAIKSFAVPCILFAAALKIADSFSKEVTLKRLSNILSKGVKWIAGILVTVFLAAVGIFANGIPQIETIGAKTAKYALGSFVPVVGGMLSESMELIFTSSKVLKSGVGMAGLSVILGIVFVPIVNILVKIIIIHIIAALSEPIVNERVSSLLGDMAEALTLLFTMVLFVSLMFFIGTAVII